jgi:peptide deformylase
MSDILTINTEQDVIKKDQVEPLPLYDDTFRMLQDEIPEYTDPLPNASMNKLVARLKVTMKKFGGLGLSANQCGVYERVFILGYGDEAFACINPKVIEKSEEIERSKEGCLSYPGMFLTVPRHKWIVAEFTNVNGEVQQMRFEGITARCFLHELDHMNGIRFVDHVGPVSIQTAKRKQQKLIKSTQRKMGRKDAIFV